MSRQDTPDSVVSNSSAASESRHIAIWAFDPLPDFISDHTLTGQTPAERLREYAARWVQLAGSLWEWADRATFALRYVARAGRVQVFLLASAHHAADGLRLQSELEVVLRAHRLWQSATRMVDDKFRSDTALHDVVIAQIRQHEMWNLWAVPRNRLGNSEDLATRFPGINEQEWRTPRVIYPWSGPGGPFLLPMESLISQPVACSLTIYLEPTRLRPIEWQWLALMAREAQSAAEQNLQEAFTAASARVADPAAGLAGRLYLGNLRRLSAAPFRVTVHAAAADGRTEATLALASAVQSLVHEPAFERPQQEDDRLPSGAMVVMPPAERGGDLFQQFVRRQYDTLRFEDPPGCGPLYRMADLCDAQGASTVFRLPVSVRGGVPGVRVRQLAPDFHPGARELEAPAGSIRLGEYQSGGGAFVPIKDLTKHTLITGFTGSGKTVTVLQILHQLWDAPHNIPFLVIESAKQEYRGLAAVPIFKESLRIYTLGNDVCVPFRLNPFQLMPGVRVEAHLSKLQTCFEAAIPPVGPSSSIIAEALQLVYEQRGWRLTDICGVGHHRRFPELADFVSMVKDVLKKRNYLGEVLANLEAALLGRFRPLLFGSKGAMFGCQLSSPSPEDLFNWPTVLEMNDLNLDDKALVTMFVLTMLREYRDLHRSERGELVHVTMVEEAHNILEEVGSNAGGDATSGDARHKAVQAFCSLLTEIRALGEGLVIADQSPTKLARDAMRNTNLQIAHQLRDGDDRKAVANAMIMENEQRDFLGKLPPGQAAVFRTGLEKATFIFVDLYYPAGASASDSADIKAKYRGAGFRTKFEDVEVRQHMLRLDGTLSDRSKIGLPYASNGCGMCQCQCEFRDKIYSLFDTSTGRVSAEEWFHELQSIKETRGQISDGDIIGSGIRHSAAAIGSANVPDVAAERREYAWCAFVHLVHLTIRDHEWGLQLGESDRRLFESEWASRETGEVND